MVRRNELLTLLLAGFMAADVAAITIVLPGIGEVKIQVPGQSAPEESAQPAPAVPPAVNKPVRPPGKNRPVQQPGSDQEGEDDVSNVGKRPVEIWNEPSGGGFSTTRRRYVPALDPVKTAKAPYADALKCAALLDLANIINKRIDGFIQPSASSWHPLWDKMIDLHPKMKGMPFAEADVMRTKLLRKFTGDNFDRYRDDQDLLRKDYQKCLDTGMFR